MQKWLLILFLSLVNVTVYSQTNSDTVKTKQIQYFLKVDSIQSQMNDMNNRLYSFHYQNRTSQKLYGISLICTIASIFILGDLVESDNFTKVAMPIMAGVTSGIGTVIYLDSFKFLDTKRKLRKHY